MDYKYKLDYHLIAKRIKDARKLSGLTQEQLAEKIGISTNAVAKLENNLMTASLQTLVNIANVLNIDMNTLFLQNTDDTQSNLDEYLINHIRGLSIKDKEFLVHIINGLQIYKLSKNI